MQNSSLQVLTIEILIGFAHFHPLFFVQTSHAAAKQNQVNYTIINDSKLAV